MKGLTGIPIGKYIRDQRLRKANEMLKTGELNVTEVAYAVGFTDPSYFTKVYFDYFKENPSRTKS